MWNKPQLMTAVADLLLAAATAALLMAAVLWVTRLPHFRLTQVNVVSAPVELRPEEIEQALDGLLHGNFFSVNVEALRQSLERLPWVRRADVRRRWPSSLDVRIEEHEPAARWGEGGGGQLVNSHGELFTAVQSSPRALPVLSGPPAVASELLGWYRQSADLLRPLGRAPKSLHMSPRLALQLKLDDGMVVELGREQSKLPLRARLQRFVDHYPSVLAAGAARPSVVDMRYPNGFALRAAPAAVPATERKGK
ncbi:MAG: cell division protein FtsQ/DivIB [Azospira sp.]|jgi:cell division protein FtsQ|nr:cell division protein FtsQ/DivIB [Azospira sp.]